MKKWIARIVVVSLILGALYYQPVKAADLYVSTSGSDTGNCQTSPCKTIGYAVGQATSNSTIHVAAGLYNTALGETFPIGGIGGISKNLTLQGVSAVMIAIDATGTGADVIEVNGVIVNISGFTIINGKNGLYYHNGASGTITSNTIVNNSINGISSTTSSNPTITNNVIDGNSKNGIENSSSSPTITNNTIVGNTVDGISNSSSSNPTITNNTIWENDGTGIYNDSSNPTITNNTISRNGYQGIYNDSSSPTITNNIISGNGGDGIYNDSSSFPVCTYNDVWSNLANGFGNPGTGSISADPLFISSTDFHLQDSSPAINIGNNSASGIPATDKDGNARISCGIVDMGAYEIQCPKIQKKLKLIPSILPAVQNHISQGNELLKQANDLLTQAKSKNLDTSTCEKLINEVNELLEKANKVKASPITANYFALKAIAKLTQAIECLKTLIG